MNAKELREGMIVKCSYGTKIKVTYVPSLDKYDECFFSGIIIETKDNFYKDKIGQNFSRNWNSAFYYPA
jgi:hypothetical protein